MEEKKEETKLDQTVEWAIKNKKWVIASFCAFFVLVFLVFQDSSNMSFFNSEKLCDLWKEKKEKKIFDELSVELARNPSLQPRYQSIITDYHLSNHDLVSASKEYAKSSHYLKKVFPFYDEFSKNTLLIEKKENQKALDHSLALQDALKNSQLESSLLYEYNLLRIALLYQKCGAFEKELLTYKMMESHTHKLPFSQKELSFSDYVAHRKKKVKK